MRKTYMAIGALALLGVLVIAGCGSGGGSTSGGSNGGGASEESSSEPASASTGGAYGGGGYGGGESAGAAEEGAGKEASAKPAAAATGGATGGAVMVIKAGKAGDLGTVITDSTGMTVYDFHKDKGTTSSCYGACEQAWPPVITSGKTKASGGAQSSMLGTTKRKDGSLQVTYHGHPLYTFAGDKKPGEANGNDSSEFGAQWYALEPNGEEPADS
jgi:predicted lipoprotein with Yx(FWY)xxD motif